MFTREISNRLAREFKFAFNEAIAFADETQESVAAKLGVTQAQINNWTNPNSERNFPIALFPLLPIRMQHFLIKHISESHTPTELSQLNGSVDDEIIRLVNLESDLQKMAKGDAKNALKTIGKMREVLDRAEKEVEAINKK